MKVKSLKPEVIAHASILIADIVQRIDIAQEYSPEVLEALKQTYDEMARTISNRASIQAITNEHPMSLNRTMAQGILLNSIISVYIARLEQKQ
jgi:hypothetical protein